jgi:CIC family chloride channel protein
MRHPPPQPNVHVRDVVTRYSASFWLLVVLTGVGAGLGGGLLMKLLHTLQRLAWSYSSGTFLQAVEQGSAGRHVLVLFGAGVLVGAGQWVLHRTGRGGGGELAETIWFRSGIFPTLRTLSSAVLSIVIVGLGGSVGREGALKQTGATIASRLSLWTGLSPEQRRLLAACGAGAGMAAAYNVPLGGGLFALEVLLGDLALPLVAPALAASCLATVVSWLLLPDRPTYTVPVYATTSAQLVWAVVAGPLLGLATVLYVRAIAWADRLEPHGWRLSLAPVVVFTVLGGLGIPFPQLLGNGKDTVQLAFTGQFGWELLLVLPALKLLATASCLGSGAPGGLFTPTLTYGALLGGLLGEAWNYLWPGAPPGSYAILGGGAVLAVATQGPLSAVVLLLELTWRSDGQIAPLVLAIVGAMLVGRLFESRSIYSARIHLGRAAAVAERGAAQTAFGDLRVEDCEVISAAALYSEVARRLLSVCPRHLFLCVADERGRLVGIITADRASSAASLALPLETVTAADLSRPVPTISSSASREAVLRQLQASGLSQLPVVEPASGRLVGVVGEEQVP